MILTDAERDALKRVVAMAPLAPLAQALLDPENRRLLERAGVDCRRLVEIIAARAAAGGRG